MALLELQSVSKWYGTADAPVYALREISLQVREGEFIALVGRSGSGKSTLLNLCGAMDFPSSGAVLIDGLPTSDMNDSALTRLRREKTGFIFQSFQLLHTLTAVENVEMPLLLARRSNLARRTALERLRSVGLEELADRYPHQLSGGQQQRVAIARALANQPKVLLADEPTGNLDTATGTAILQLLRRITQEFGTAVIMATHSPDTAPHLDGTINLRDGQMQPELVRGE